MIPVLWLSTVGKFTKMFTHNIYRKISNIRRTKCQNLNDSRLVLQLSVRRQAMLQLHLSYRQFYCQFRCVFSHLGFLLQSTRSIICLIDNVMKHWSVDITHTLTHKYIPYIHMVLGDWLIMLCCHSEQKYDLCIIERQWKSLVEDSWLPASHCCRVCVIAVVHNIILNS